MAHETDRDRIHIRDLKLKCIIGINPEERKYKQQLIISVVVFTDITNAGVTDSLDETIDYSVLTDRIVEHVEHSSYMLIEKLAVEIARICLEPERSQEVTVLVEKPGALKRTKKVGVEIYRSREQLIEET